MHDEEEHIDFLEIQIELVARIGLELYAQRHVGEFDENLSVDACFRPIGGRGIGDIGIRLRLVHVHLALGSVGIHREFITAAAR